jgi:hypothetical protein
MDANDYRRGIEVGFEHCLVTILDRCPEILGRVPANGLSHMTRVTGREQRGPLRYSNDLPFGRQTAYLELIF